MKTDEKIINASILKFKMRVIIFGATGYIGNSLCAFLRKKNIKIIKFSKRKKHFLLLKT